MLNLNANMEGLFHVKHESKNLETRKIHKRNNHHSFIVLKIKKDQKSDLYSEHESDLYSEHESNDSE